MSDRLITPSKVTAWLDCAHYLTLRNQVDDGLLPDPGQPFGSFARLLADKGLAHENDCLADYRRQPKSILEVPSRKNRERFSAWVARIDNPLDGNWDVVYQMPFVHDGMRGVADFLVRVTDPETGRVSYEPVDAKLARAKAKPGHVLQLCFYAEAIEALTGVRPRRMHLWLGSGRVESLRVDDFSPYWRRLRTQLSAALAAGPESGTVPEPCPHCEFCEFSAVCEQQWRDEDSLIYVAGIRRLERAALGDGGVTTLAGLAELDAQVEGVRQERLAVLVGQAVLQVEARLQSPDNPPPSTIIEPGDDPVWGHGLEELPAPDDGDIFLDFEGHPFWRADTGLFFLFGLLERDAGGKWCYRPMWAHDQTDEAANVPELVAYLDNRREQFPGMHVYHYNHTERSSLERLSATYGVAEAQLARCVDTGLFVDLFPVARNAIQVGTESYGLKHLERLTDFQRGHDIDKGASAVIEYETFTVEGNPASLDRIAAYNEDDVRATLALREWLVSKRPPEMPWRAAFLDPDPNLPEPDERIAALHAFPGDTDEHFLGDLLGYWTREWLAYITPRKVRLLADLIDQLDDDEVVAGLQPGCLVERTGKTGKPITPGFRFSFLHQMLDGFPREGGTVMYLLPDGTKAYAEIVELDREAGELVLVWNKAKQELGYFPSAAVVHEWVPTTVKAEALSDFAARVLDHNAPNAVTTALLRGELPQFIEGAGPAGGKFTDNLAEMTKWVTRLDRSYVAIQGPPGTGKTYSAAHLVHALIAAGCRVGITAMSHAAIGKLLREILDVFRKKGDTDLLRAVRNPGTDSTPRHPGVTYGDNQCCARTDFNLVAGTTWLFASKAMRAAPVDVLLVDEAGQLSLADALAASCAATNLILLGDPLQLAQVAHAVHPGGSGRSALDHILGLDEVLDDDPTMPDDRGVFLSKTWRMHDDVCGFISDEIYGGHLGSHPDCKQQTTVAGTGLRRLRADHRGNSTQSPEEAELIAAEIAGLIGTPWTNQKGKVNRLTVKDFMVVAPYNDQVHTIRDRLATDPRIAGVPVGTVDKFQGQEAAVVFFSMTTSSGDDMTRGPEFLFSRNRLNVAISRARCLAYLVCTDELLDTRARSVEDMRLIATLNAFVEYVDRQHPPSE
jgi:uncharacterized protein